MLTTKIKSIKKIGKKQVYDFKVPIYHNFILGNNIVVHNCGKSTLGVIMSRRVSSVFTKLKRFDKETVNYYWERVSKQIYPTYEEFIEKLWELKEANAYKYKIKRDTIYTREKIIKAFDSDNSIFLGDEAILSAFNRDFYSEEQKNLIKIINLNRDKGNLFLGCVPTFNVLDTQIKGLTKMRLTVLRRGLALIHTPNNKMMFSSDAWDTNYNLKIEQTWLKKKVRKPAYAKLTTVRGLLQFPDLPEGLRKIYEGVKKDERNVIANEQFGIGDKEEQVNPVKALALQITTNGIKNSAVIDGFAMGLGLKTSTLRTRLVREIKAMGKDYRLSQYFWDKDKADKTDKSNDKIKRGEPKLSLIQKIRTK